MEPTVHTRRSAELQVGDEVKIMMINEGFGLVPCTAKLLGPLGKGTQGLVWEAGVDFGGERFTVALKIPHTKGEVKELIQEGSMLSKLDSPYTCKLLGFVNPRGKQATAAEHCGLVLKSYSGCLFSVVKATSLEVTMRSSQKYLTMVQILAGLVHLNRHNLIHCDVKPGNILLSMTQAPLDDGYFDLAAAHFNVVLADLGSLKSLSSDRPVRCGTVLYMCPVQMMAMSERGASPGRHQSLDVWSLGMTLAELQCGPEINLGIQQRGGRGLEMGLKVELAHRRKEWVGFVEECLARVPGERFRNSKWMDVIRKCLNYDPEQRPTPLQLLEDVLIDPEFEMERLALRADNIELPDLKLLISEKMDQFVPKKPEQAPLTATFACCPPAAGADARKAPTAGAPATEAGVQGAKVQHDGVITIDAMGKLNIGPHNDAVQANAEHDNGAQEAAAKSVPLGPFPPLPTPTTGPPTSALPAKNRSCTAHVRAGNKKPCAQGKGGKGKGRGGQAAAPTTPTTPGTPASPPIQAFVPGSSNDAEWPPLG